MSRIFFKKNGQKPSVLISIGLVAALFAVFLNIIAGPAYMFGIYGDGDNNPADLILRFQILGVMGITLAIAGIATICGIIHARISPRVRSSWRAIVSLALVIVMAIPLWLMGTGASKYPPIHDITTDLNNPPQFDQIPPRTYDATQEMGLRGGRLDPEHATLHQSHYGFLEPITVDLSVSEAISRAELIALELGWTIINSNSETGVLEAFDTTPWFGFRDNIVIKAETNEAGATIIHIRSVSEVGISDLGVNAKRIQKFISAYHEGI